MTKNVKAKVSDTMKSRRQIAALITLLMLITVSSVFAQGTKKLTGIVSDLSGEPLIGVSIVVKGTTIGTVTDLNGGYSLNIPDENKKATLIFTYVGYLKQEISVNNKHTLNVIMKEDDKLLDEVVVVGYGVQKRVNMTGSVASVKSEKMTLCLLPMFPMHWVAGFRD